MSLIKLYNGDCFEVMNNIEDHSIDMIFTDLPYATTNNSWDFMIDLDRLWAHYKRVIKKNGCIALWAQAPFSHILAVSNLKWYRYEWIIEKTRATGHLNANKMPMKAHENVLLFSEGDGLPETVQIFYNKLPTYNPQKTTGHKPVNNYIKHSDNSSNYGAVSNGICGGGQTDRYPRDVLHFSWDTQKLALHPTQKPLDACLYFVRTYTDEGDTLLDSCMGSGTIGVACKELNRNFIGIELDENNFYIANNRIINSDK